MSKAKSIKISWELHPDLVDVYHTDYWRFDHLTYTRDAWQYEVRNEDTQLGYWEWLSGHLFDDDNE